MARVALNTFSRGFEMPLTFVCLNLWEGGTLLDNILAFLRREKPDVLATQETYNSRDRAVPQRYRSIEILARELDFPYVSFTPAFQKVLPEGTFEQGNAIFSKFPILDTRTIFYDIPHQQMNLEGVSDFSCVPRNLQHAVIEYDGATLNVFNTQGIWGFDGDDNERRLAMSDVIAREVSGKPRVILAGDFNVREQTQAIRNIEVQLVNVFKGELQTSFNLRHKNHEGFAGAVVDMVFVSRDIRVLAHSVPEDDVSDHLPLVCKFEIA